MPSRRAHEKNRLGCHQCKSRHVKCDLQFPVCGSCIRRSEPCFRGQLSTPTSNQAHVTISTWTPRAESLPLLELELIHHFTTTVYRTLSDEIVAQGLWQREVPTEALQHTHLMHATLALSALHLRCISGVTQPAAIYRKSAIHHYGMALSQLRPLVVQIDPSNSGSMLATSTLLGFFTFVYSRFSEDHSRLIETLISMHEQDRGVAAILAHTSSDLTRTKVFSVFNPVPGDDVVLPAAFQRGMEILRAHIITLGDEGNQDIYLGVVHTLQEKVKAEIANPKLITLNYMLLRLADRRYMKLLAARDQMALVIFAHYAIILHRQRHRWWIGDTGVQVMQEVKRFLSSDFATLIEWPEHWLANHDGINSTDAQLYYSWSNSLG